MTTADRLLSILQLFTAGQAEWTVDAAAAELGISVSNTYRYFRSLGTAGLIVAFGTGRYVLGPAIIEYDRQIRTSDPMINVARPVMRRFAHERDRPAVMLLCRFFRNRVMCVHQEGEVTFDAALSYERGLPMPLFRGAASKIIFAFLPSRTAKAFHERYAEQIDAVGLGANWEEVRRNLRLMRNLGYSTTHAELDAGVYGVAAPVFGPDTDIVGSLGMVLDETNESPESLKQAGQDVMDAAAEISAALAIAGRAAEAG
jgi:DNA-binding IclR family transcriptional regulator